METLVNFHAKMDPKFPSIRPPATLNSEFGNMPVWTANPVKFDVQNHQRPQNQQNRQRLLTVLNLTILMRNPLTSLSALIRDALLLAKKDSTLLLLILPNADQLDTGKSRMGKKP